MEKNFVLFVVLSAAILFTWQMTHPTPKAPPAAQTPVPGEASSEPAAIAPAPAPSTAGTARPGPAQDREQSFLKPKKLTVSNDVVQATFNDVGASLVSWKLLKYEQSPGKSTDPVEIIPVDASAAKSGEGYGAFHMEGLNLTTRRWQLLTPAPEKKGEALRVAFSTPMGESGKSPVITKEFLFFPGRYDAEVSIRVENNTASPWDLTAMNFGWGPSIGNTILDADKEYGDKFLAGCLVQTADEKVFEKPDDPGILKYKDPKWAAIRNQYFVAALLPSSGFSGAQIERIARVPPGGNGIEEMMAVALTREAVQIKAGESIEMKARLLGSHQEYSFLKSFGNNLQGVVQFTPWKIFRILDPLATGMLYVLKWFHSLVGNWGVSLIFLTLLVKGLMFYPTMKGMVSMRKMSAKMAAMKPRLDTIKKMYKDDPNRLNQEMMKLYKEEGVNPLGGCLPLLVQMPIFFALYGTLLGSFELRGAEFFWIWTDLSQAEPQTTPVLALLMASSMYLQQKMTPQPSAQMNPEQAKMQKMMMNIMPVMLGAFAIFGGWPSGLLLYWAASNIFSIVQQMVVNRKYPVENPVAPTVPPAAA